MSNVRMVNETEVLELIDQLRTTIPEEVKTAKLIQQQRDRVIAQGKEEANRMIEIARQQASGLVDAHELVRAAENRSQTIIERAQREASDIRKGADAYAEQVLSILDERIAHAQHQIRSGLIELGRRHADEQAPAEESEGTEPAPTVEEPIRFPGGKSDNRP